MRGAGGRPRTATLATAVLLAAVAGGRPGFGQPPAAPDSDVPPVATRLAWENPAGPPPPRISLPVFADRGFATFGWIDAGIGGNNWGSPFNGPITFPDRSWQGQVNQCYLATERVADADSGDWDWGGRVDLLLGTDSIFTTARGLDAYSFQRYGTENVASWSFSKDYGLALPQLYADVTRSDVGQPGGLAQWYSFNQYLFWRFNDRWAGGVRLEYFRDNNGYLVAIPIRNLSQAGNPGFYSSGFAGNFWELTWGLNYRPNRNWVFRPELRYDWFTPNAGVTKRPYGSGVGQGINTAGDQLGQFYAGCDAIWRF